MALQAVGPDALATLKQQQVAKRKVNMAAAVKDIKASKFFEENWNDLLQAAPNCLELLATCAAVATSDAAGGIEITKPPNGKFDYLKHVRPLPYSSLKGCLAQVSNQGQKSFQFADEGMADIAGKCKDVKTFVDRIVMALCSTDAPIYSLMGHMSDLKNASTSCRDTAIDIHKSFGLWQDIAMELYAACNNESSNSEKRQKELKEKLSYSKTVSIEQDAVTKKYEEAVTNMNSRVDECKEEYKQQLNDFPGAWTLLGQQMAMGLTEAVGTAAVVGTSIAAQSAAAAANPLGTASQLAGAAGKFQGQSQPVNVIVNGGQQSAIQATGTETAASKVPVKDADKAEEAAGKKEAGLSKLRSLFTAKSVATKLANGKGTAAVTDEPTRASTTTEATDAKALDAGSITNSTTAKAGSDSTTAATWPVCDGKFYPTDPAMSSIDVIITYVDGVRSLVIDADDVRNVNWDDIIAKAGTTDQPAKNTKAFTLQCQLERKKKDFVPDKKGLASQLTTRILADSLAVVTELLEEGKRSKNLGDWQKPDQGSEQVRSWDERISRCHEAATVLKQSANSTPGVVPGGLPSLFPQKTDAEVQASTNLKTNLAAETVKAATTKLTSTQDVYKSTLNTYKEMKDKSVQFQLELSKTRAEVAQLELQTVTEANVRQVLVQCIGFLSELKMKIGKLVQFFKGVTIFVKSICESQVEPFQREIQMMIDNNKGNELKAFRYNAYLRDIIFQLTLQIYAQFQLFKDITSMYREVHAKCILEGLDLVGKCQIPPAKALADMTAAEKEEYNKVVESRRQDMSAYTTKAAKTVADIVRTKQEEIINGIQKRVTEIGQEIAAFPEELQPTPAQKQAITDGREIAENTNKENAFSQPSGMGLMTQGEVILDDD